MTEDVGLSGSPAPQRSGETLNEEAQSVGRSFVGLNEEVADRQGYDLRRGAEASSTQQLYESKTKLRCDRERGPGGGTGGDGAPHGSGCGAGAEPPVPQRWCRTRRSAAAVGSRRSTARAWRRSSCPSSATCCACP